ncbi:MAG: class I SAM-dependent methyltransferase [Oligoflexia bacterium]|nr:class I SAM-dependent methyltransferase [Oligoflexia bacterium]
MINKIIKSVLENPRLYLLWQGTFVKQKINVINDIGACSKILDIGCGAGTNNSHFIFEEYVGVDINPKYISYAKKNCKGSFYVADAIDCDFCEWGKFDTILLNSFLHHVDGTSTVSILSNARKSLDKNGFIHIIDIICLITIVLVFFYQSMIVDSTFVLKINGTILFINNYHAAITRNIA